MIMHLSELVGMGMMKELDSTARRKNRNIVIFKMFIEINLFNGLKGLFFWVGYWLSTGKMP